MLVLSRRANERIVFPSLGITIHILKLTGSGARVGIEAPAEVTVLRDELCATPVMPGSAPAGKADHALANALSKITLAIHLTRKQSEAGRSADADATLETALASLEALERARRQPAAAAPRCRALIVEDDANERELLAGLLGMKCEQVGDGEDALAYLEAGGRPHVVPLDMALPRCDGPETLRRIRADSRYAGLKVFSVSSTHPREWNIPEGPAGFDAWFAKPLNPRRLWDAMQASLGSSAPAHAN